MGYYMANANDGARAGRSAAKQVYQLKISLDYIQPQIWRRVLVEPSIRLGALHDVIQGAMGWTDSHLHRFDADGKQYTAPFDEPFERGQRDETNVLLRRVLPEVSSSIRYEYDFGDSWFHTITLEDVLPADTTLTYPAVIDGERACPPEDCGSLGGYDDIVRALKGERVDEMEELLAWLPPGYNPEVFSVAEASARVSAGPVKYDWAADYDAVAQASQGLTESRARAYHDEVQQELDRLKPKTIEQRKRIMADVAIKGNRVPRDQYGGLTLEALAYMLDAPFDSPQFIVFPEKLNEDFASPVGALFELLAGAIGTGGLKATVTGNLPRNLVREIAEKSMTADKLDVVRQIRPLQTEVDYMDLHVTRVLGEECGLIRKVKGKFLLSKTCQKLMAVDGVRSIYPRLLRMYATKLNWGYRSRFEINPHFQVTFAFSLYLLDRFGDDWRPTTFYSDALLKAFPRILSPYRNYTYSTPESMFASEHTSFVFKYFAVFFGLAEAQYEDEKYYSRIVCVRKTKLLDHAVQYRTQ
jgi:hypothetical protein